MPVLESTDNKITPKSILRYRPIGDTDSRSERTTSSPKISRASRLRPTDLNDGYEDPQDIAEWRHEDHSKEDHQVPHFAPAGRMIRTTIPTHAAHRSPHTTGPQSKIAKPWRMFPSLSLRKPELSQLS